MFGLEAWGFVCYPPVSSWRVWQSMWHLSFLEKPSFVGLGFLSEYLTKLREGAYPVFKGCLCSWCSSTSQQWVCVFYLTHLAWGALGFLSLWMGIFHGLREMTSQYVFEYCRLLDLLSPYSTSLDHSLSFSTSSSLCASLWESLQTYFLITSSYHLIAFH